MIRTRLQGDTPFFPNMLNNGKVEVCLKEDVDKALVEKDKAIANRDYEIEELKKSIGRLLKTKTEQVIDEVMQKALIYGEGFVRVEDMMKLISELRHHKFKRCLAMARMCEAEAHKCLTQQGALVDFKDADRFQYLQWHFMHFSRWHKRWLELAQKFKEAK